MAKRLKLYTLSKDESVLRGNNSKIVFPLTNDLKKLIQDMKLTVRKAPGIGLAAPQVGKNLMLAIINLEQLGPPFAIVNPRVVSKSIKKEIMEEGCLSIPAFYAKIKRPKRVEVEMFTEDGKRVLFKADGLFAKVLQHEIDHLNGILIADK